MKDIEHIEELLNSYIDNELDERGNNEVKRLIDNDKTVQQLFESLSRCKTLLGSLKISAAPEGFSDIVAMNLERSMLLADMGTYQNKKGRRRLILRKFFTAAAMIALMAVLSYVVFDVFVPNSSRQKFADNVLHRKQKPQVIYEKPFANVQPAEDKQLSVKKFPLIPLVARLTLVTSNPVEADWLVGKALMSTTLFDKTTVVDRKTGIVRYVLNCDRSSIVDLVAELNIIWPKCHDATLEIGTEQQGKYITVKNATARQTLDICKADNYNQRIRMANDLAVINEVAGADVLKSYYAQKNTDADFTIPEKPALTSSEAVEQPKSSKFSDPATITITIIAK